MGTDAVKLVQLLGKYHLVNRSLITFNHIAEEYREVISIALQYILHYITDIHLHNHVKINEFFFTIITFSKD